MGAAGHIVGVAAHKAPRFQVAPLEEKLLGLMRKLDGDTAAGDDGAPADASGTHGEAESEGRGEYKADASSSGVS